MKCNSKQNFNSNNKNITKVIYSMDKKYLSKNSFRIFIKGKI